MRTDAASSTFLVLARVLREFVQESGQRKRDDAAVVFARELRRGQALLVLDRDINEHVASHEGTHALHVPILNAPTYKSPALHTGQHCQICIDR